MKKYIFYSFIAILLLNLNQVNSQSLNQFGLKAGSNLMEIRSKLSDDSVTKVNKTGFYIGAFMEFRKSLDLAIQAEINYSSTPNEINDNIGLLHIPEALSIDARYNWAISSYRDLGYREYIKLNFIQVGLAYKFEN